jgi:hypothetical protein
MRTIELTQAQVDAICNKLAEVHDTSDSFNIDIDIDELSVTAEGNVEIDGYIEDDAHCGYMKGTGAYVETYRNASVTLTGWVYNPFNEEIEEVEIASESVKKVSDYLNAA